MFRSSAPPQTITSWQNKLLLCPPCQAVHQTCASAQTAFASQRGGSGHSIHLGPCTGTTANDRRSFVRRAGGTAGDITQRSPFAFNRPRGGSSFCFLFGDHRAAVATYSRLCVSHTSNTSHCSVCSCYETVMKDKVGLCPINSTVADSSSRHPVLTL